MNIINISQAVILNIRRQMERPIRGSKVEYGCSERRVQIDRRKEIRFGYSTERRQ